MQSKATTVARYLAQLPAERRAALSAVRKVILANLDPDYDEGMQYGMIGYYVPHHVFPAGYHCDPRQPLPFACLASQKNHMSLYLMSAYGQGLEQRWLREQFARAGKRLDMGKSCIRFRKLEDLPLEVIGAAIRRVPAKAYVEHYQRAISSRNPASPARAGKAKTVPAVKQRAPKASSKVAAQRSVARKTRRRPVRGKPVRGE